MKTVPTLHDVYKKHKACVDVFSRYAFVRPSDAKSLVAVADRERDKAWQELKDIRSAWNDANPDIVKGVLELRAAKYTQYATEKIELAKEGYDDIIEDIPMEYMA